MFKEYHETLDKLYKTLNIKASRRRMDNFRNNLKKVAQRGENAIDNERGRLMRRFEQLKQEINTLRKQSRLPQYQQQEGQ